MLGDMIQDRWGWHFRDNGDGSADSLSAPRGDNDPVPLVPVAEIEAPVVLLRNGEPTGDGADLSTRLALFLHRKRYADAGAAA